MRKLILLLFSSHMYYQIEIDSHEMIKQSHIYLIVIIKFQYETHFFL